MAINLPVRFEGVLSSGSNTLYTVPSNRTVVINSITFSNPVAYDVELSINRVSPAGSVVAYSFTLAAGDVLKDSNTYNLRAGDSLSVTTSVAGTNCLLYGVALYGVSGSI